MVSPNKIIKAMNPKNPNNNTVLITLWTWQNKKVSLVKDEKLDNLKHSFYCNKESDCSIEKHREVYKMVFDKLHTDQIIWCFTDSDEAVEEGNIQEFEVIQKRILWEIDVSEKEIKWFGF